MRIESKDRCRTNRFGHGMFSLAIYSIIKSVVAHYSQFRSDSPADQYKLVQDCERKTNAGQQVVWPQV